MRPELIQVEYYIQCAGKDKITCNFPGLSEYSMFSAFSETLVWAREQAIKRGWLKEPAHEVFLGYLGSFTFFAL